MGGGKRGVSASLVLGVLVFGLLGAARGLDDGSVSGNVSQHSFQKQFGFHKRPAKEVADIKSNIVSMSLIGSILGILVGLFVNDAIGRVRALRLCIVLWIVGVIVQITTFGGVGQLYAGRVVAGLGCGMTTVVCPTYLVEVAPRAIRGRCTNIFAGSIYLGIMLGYFANWGTSLHMADSNRNQWVVPTTIQIMYGGLGFIGSFFVVESPRWLLKTGRDKEGVKVLMALRQMERHEPDLAQELGEIYAQISEEREIDSKFTVFKELVRHGSNRYRLLLGLLIQLLGQWSGASAVTLYAPDIFQIVGISHGQRLLASSMFGVVKFVAAIACALFMVDYLGRKRALYIGISIQLFSLLYLAIYLSFRQRLELSPAIERAGMAATVMIYLNGVGWAMGWNSVQYLFNAEVFPTSLRSVATGLISMFHYLNLFSCSKALPEMFLVLHPWGTMAFFTVITFIGIVFCFFFLPEVAGMSLEHIEYLFLLPWYKIGRASKKTTESDYLKCA